MRSAVVTSFIVDPGVIVYNVLLSKAPSDRVSTASSGPAAGVETKHRNAPVEALQAATKPETPFASNRLLTVCCALASNVRKRSLPLPFRLLAPCQA